jgi:hypothetical protein
MLKIQLVSILSLFHSLMTDLSSITVAAREREREEKAAARTQELEPFMTKFSSLLKHCWDKMELGSKDADLNNAANQGQQNFECATMPKKLARPIKSEKELDLVSKTMKPFSANVRTTSYGFSYTSFLYCIQSRQDSKNQLCFRLPERTDDDVKFYISWNNHN